MTRPSLPAYLSTWSEEILSRANRVRQLIGSRHWLTDGSYKEVLVREFLIRHLPNDLNVSKGFIRHLDSETVSPEVDLLVTDPKRHVPIFNEGGFQIVAPSSLLATMEIKSTYSSAVLREALSNVVKVRQVALKDKSAEELWSAVIVVFGGPGLSPTELVRHTRAILTDNAFWEPIRPDAPAERLRHLLPGMICVLDSCTLFVNADLQPMGVALKAFRTEALSAAFTFAQLFAYLRASLTSEHIPGELESLLERCSGLEVDNATVQLPTK